MNTFRGILPALVTPVDNDQCFQAKSFEALLERVYGYGADGVYVCGQTGEGLLQPVGQRKLIAEAAVRNSPKGKHVIIHIGSYRVAEAVELSRHASAIGAAAISSLPPLGSYSFKQIKKYYEKLAATTEIPLLIYFFPELCPAVNSVEHVAELCGLPNVAGLKFTDFDLYKLATIKCTGVTVFNGRDEVLAAGLLMGADGGIGTFYNLIPELFVELYRLTRADQWLKARAVQMKINELIRLTLRFPTFQAVKQMLTWSGIDCGPCLGPQPVLTDDERCRLSEALAASSFADHVFAGVGSR